MNKSENQSKKESAPSEAVRKAYAKYVSDGIADSDGHYAPISFENFAVTYERAQQPAVSVANECEARAPQPAKAAHRSVYEQGLFIATLKAELERVKGQLREFAELAVKAERQRDELLAACSEFAGFSFTDYEARFNTTAALGRLVMLKRRARLAIAAVEGRAS